MPMHRHRILGGLLAFAATAIAGTASVGTSGAEATTRFQVNSTVDASVRNCPPSSTGCGYVIGHLRAGSTFDATYRPSSDSASWAYGYGYGQYNGCGWVQNGNLSSASGTPQTLCSESGTSFHYTSFMTEINALPGSGTSDGSPAHIDYNHTNCDPAEAGRGYGNVNVFGTGATTPDLYYGTLNHGDYVLYRYTTENGMWAMVRDPYPDWGAPADNWFFVRRSCLTPEAAPIPTG
jgi:hypothetical protein